MARLLGCGIDDEEFNRFSRHLDLQHGVSGFLEMVFTREEISRNMAVLPHLTFPLAFSCKEAVFKAFGRSWTNSPLAWKDIEVIFNDQDDLTDHEVRLGGAAAQMFRAMGGDDIESSFEIGQDYVVFEVLFIPR